MALIGSKLVQPSGFLLILGILYFHPVIAADFQSPRTVGLGGAGHASPFLADATYLNPSFMAQMPLDAVAMNYSGPGTNTDAIINCGIIGADRNLPIQIGVSYTQQGNRSLTHLSASTGFGDRFSMGVAGKMINPSNVDTASSFDLMVSASIVISSSLRVALIADNLLNTSRSSGFLREYTLGTRIQVNSLVFVYLDPHLHTDDQALPIWGYQAGIELRLAEYFFIRSGGFNQSMQPFQKDRSAGVSLGFGLTLPKISMDYALRQKLLSETNTVHHFGITVFF